MKKYLVRFLAVLALVGLSALTVLADTIRLKDGSVIRGQIVSFKDQQFTILVGSGTKGRYNRITIYTEDVESIEFDGQVAGDNSGGNTGGGTTGGGTTGGNTGGGNTGGGTSGTPASDRFLTFQSRVLADNTANGWTNTGIVLRRGQRVRITSTGTISLGRGNGNVTPAGLPSVRDPRKLMPNDATGGLIAVISDDNDDFIFVGRNREFVAQRDGVLFLGINEDYLNDNTGAFNTTIEVSIR